MSYNNDERNTKAKSVTCDLDESQHQKSTSRDVFIIIMDQKTQFRGLELYDYHYCLNSADMASKCIFFIIPNRTLFG